MSISFIGALASVTLFFCMGTNFAIQVPICSMYKTFTNICPKHRTFFLVNIPVAIHPTCENLLLSVYALRSLVTVGRVKIRGASSEQDPGKSGVILLIEYIVYAFLR